MFSHQRKDKRLREITFNQLEKVKEGLGLEWKEVAELLGVKSTQLYNYRKSGSVPSDRFYALRTALVLNVENRARDERESIYKLFM